MGKYDDVLRPFLALMENELHANAGKGDRPGWLAMTPGECLLEIFYHMGKLQKAVKKGDDDGVREYAADVANMCMMLVDLCGLLVEPVVIPMGGYDFVDCTEVVCRGDKSLGTACGSCKRCQAGDV